MERLTKHVQVAMKQLEPDFVFHQATIVDVFTLTSYVADVAIVDGTIVGIGDYTHAKNQIDATGQYLIPGLIDAHVHLESSLVTPSKFASLSLRHGVTSVVSDPHEIANVLGIAGIEYMLQASEDIVLDVFVMASSCVPATDFETSGANLTAADLAPLYNHPRVLGLAEMMNYPGVLETHPDVMQKLIDATSRGLVVDGHGPGLSEAQLNGYITAGVKTDHECEHHEEVLMRLRRGMYVLMREGTAAKNLKELLSEVNLANNNRICLCTDDKHLDDLLSEGSIDNAIRIAIEAGVDPYLAIRMATLNTAQCYRLYDRGAIAPGYRADCLLVSDLTTMAITAIYKDGVLVNPDEIAHQAAPVSVPNSVHVADELDFKLPITTKKIRAIEIIPNHLQTTEAIVATTPTTNFVGDAEQDLAKMVVIERHHQDDTSLGMAIVKGFGIDSGAIATTIAHDSHNLLVIGMNDEDMKIATQAIVDLNGGIVVVKAGEIIASLQLEVAGLITDRPIPTVLADLERLHHSLGTLGFNGAFNPFLTLSFLSLPVIPKLKLTNKGLFDVERFEFVPTEIEN
ncbi:MAG: adenine deaminase [Culicoidibacterales bacterium]